MNNQNDANVTLGISSEDDIQYFPCPICFEMLEVKYTTKSKPYLTCNNCFVQLFVRGKEGITKFMNLIPNYNYKVKSQKLIEIIDYIEELNKKLSEIEAKKPIFGENEDLNLQEKAIKKQLNNLRKKLEKN